MSQIYKSASSSPGVVTGVAGTAPIQVNNVSGVFQTGNVTVSILEQATSYINVVGPTTYNVLLTDYYISVDSTLGPVTINLPTSSAQNQEFIVKDRQGQASTNAIIIQSTGNTIDTMGSYTFVDNFESLECLFHGTNYEIF